MVSTNGPAATGWTVLPQDMLRKGMNRALCNGLAARVWGILNADAAGAGLADCRCRETGRGCVRAPLRRNAGETLRCGPPYLAATRSSRGGHSGNLRQDLE